MNYFTRYRIIIWILSAALLIAISVIGTMIYHDHSKSSPAITGSDTRYNPRKFLHQELALTSGQLSEVEKLNIQCQEPSRCIMQDLREKKQQLLDELSKENSDTIKLSALASEIGLIQSKITMTTIDQYLRIKKICTPEQREKLSNLYFELFGGPGQGGGKGARHRNGHGHNPGKQ